MCQVTCCFANSVSIMVIGKMLICAGTTCSLKLVWTNKRNNVPHTFSVKLVSKVKTGLQKIKRDRRNKKEKEKKKLYNSVLMYLDQWSPPKEESKQIGRDVITDHYGDRDNEPAEENFHSIRKTGGKFSSLRKSDQSCVWMENVCQIFHFEDGATFKKYCYNVYRTTRKFCHISHLDPFIKEEHVITIHNLNF